MRRWPCSIRWRTPRLTPAALSVSPVSASRKAGGRAAETDAGPALPPPHRAHWAAARLSVDDAGNRLDAHLGQGCHVPHGGPGVVTGPACQRWLPGSRVDAAGSTLQILQLQSKRICDRTDNVVF